MHSVFRARRAPNPFRGDVMLSWPAGAGALELAVTDIAGRIIRHENLGARDTGWRWDGTDAAGRRVRPGVYLVRLNRGRLSAATQRVVLLH